MVQKKEDPRFT